MLGSQITGAGIAGSREVYWRAGQYHEKVLAGGRREEGRWGEQHSSLPVMSLQPTCPVSEPSKATNMWRLEDRKLIIFSLTFGQLIDNVNVVCQFFVFSFSKSFLVADCILHGRDEEAHNGWKINPFDGMLILCIKPTKVVSPWSWLRSKRSHLYWRKCHSLDEVSHIVYVFI